MADNKATALKEAKYTANLILGTSPDSILPVSIDITDAVVSAVDEEKLINGNGGDPGIAYSIIGIEERADGDTVGYYRTETLRTSRSLLFIEQDISHVIDAAIVNQSQKDAIKKLIHDALNNRFHDCREGLTKAIENVPIAEECKRAIDKHLDCQKTLTNTSNSSTL